MSIFTTIRDLFKPGPLVIPGVLPPVRLEAAPLEAVPVDDFGRRLAPGVGAALVGPSFQPRVTDRRSKIMPPWNPEQIVSALLRAEQGDLSAQSELMEHMEDRDGALAGFMQTRRLAPCGLPWSVDAVSDEAAAERVAEMVRTELGGIKNFPHAIRDWTDAIGKSLSASVTDWQPGGRFPGSKFRIDRIDHISPKRYRFDWNAERFLILRDDQDGIGIEPPLYKVVIHRTRVKSGHPAKAGVLRICALYFLLRNYALKDAAVFCDVFGMPLRLGKYPDGASDRDKEDLAYAMEHLGTDAAAIVSKAVEIDLIEAKGGNTQLPYFALHKECERQMELAILGQEQTNTANKFGTRAQTESGGALVRQDLLEADCIDLQATINEQLIYPLVLFTYGQKIADTLCPRFKFHYEPPADYKGMAEVDEILHTKLKLPTTTGQLAKRYGRELPKDVDPDEVIRFDAPATPGLEPDADEADQPPARTPRAPRRPRAALETDLEQRLSSSGTVLPASGRRAQRALDGMVDDAMPETIDALAALMAPARAIVLEAKTLEEIPDRLRKAFDELPTEELETLIGRAMFIARLHGRSTAVRKAAK